jgi:hypothetical protein
LGRLVPESRIEGGVKGPAKNREWLLETLRGYFASLSQAKRNELAASLGIMPTIHVHFVDAEDGRPAGENHL